MAVRPSSDLSDSNSDFYSAGEEDDIQDEEDLEDGQDSDDEGSEDDLDVQDDETSTSVNFVVPSLQRKSTTTTTIPIRKNTTSNGVASKTTSSFNEIIICENGASNSSSSNLSAAGNNGATFDPLNTEEKDPLDIDDGDDDDDDVKIIPNPKPRQLPNSPDSKYRTDDGKLVKISLPVIKINRVAGESQEEGWKIKRKPDASDSASEVPAKRVRTNRQAIYYAEIDDDVSPKQKQRGRPRVNVPLTPHPAKQTPTKLQQPQQQQTPKPLSSVRKEKATPTPGRRGRRKRNDSEDSFEIMPYKRRQFKGAASVDVEDEDTKDDMLRTSTPTIPDVDETPSTARRPKPKSSEKRVEAKTKEQNDDSQPKTSERVRKTSESNSVSTSQLNTSTVDIIGESKKSKRGRPRKIDVERRNNASLETSRDSFASPSRRRKSRPVSAYNGADDDDSRMTNSTFGFDFEDSTYDMLEVGEIVDMDDDFKFPRRSQARPGPVKNMDHQIFPRLTADELVSCLSIFSSCSIKLRPNFLGLEK
jgi:hypothetical protein